MTHPPQQIAYTLQHMSEPRLTDCSAQEFSTVISLLQVVTDYANGDIAAHEVSGDATTLYHRP